MRFSLSWLKEHIDFLKPIMAQELAQVLTMLGLEVESFDEPTDLKNLQSARIVSAKPHPNADRLKCCVVETIVRGEKQQLNIVCGAPNVAEGKVAILALPGQRIPQSGAILKEGKIRGERSEGMMCSSDELNLHLWRGGAMIDDNIDGIVLLPEDTQIGLPAHVVLGCDDVLFDVALTPNRGDCFSVRGIARELVAVGLGTLKPLPSFKSPQSSSPAQSSTPKTPGKNSSVDIAQDARNACPHIALRLIQNLHSTPSPSWLQQKLTAGGMRSIHTIVDITNFFCLDHARPLHAYDADKIQGAITVRLSKKGEAFEGLNGLTYTLPAGLCVIADNVGVLALAGVMGGARSAVDETTKNIWLESAFFSREAVSQTGRLTHITSQARTRFERGIDPLSVDEDLERASDLIMALCGGCAAQTLSFSTPLEPEKPLVFCHHLVKKLTGQDIPIARQQKHLKALGFCVTPDTHDQWRVTKPSFRFDISCAADLVEEIMRLEGINTIETLEPLPTLYTSRSDDHVTSVNQVKMSLSARGLSEAYAWSFVSQEQEPLFDKPLILENPLSQSMSRLRDALLPGLIEAALKNAVQGIVNVALFECGSVFFWPPHASQQNHVEATKHTERLEHQHLAGLRLNSAFFEHTSRNWRTKERLVDAFDAKADLLAALNTLGIKEGSLRFDVVTHPLFEVGKAACVMLGKKVVGYFGQCQIEVAAKKRLVAAGFEINLDALPHQKKKSLKPFFETTLPRVKRDFAFIVDHNISAQRLLDAAKKGAGPLLENITLFDVFGPIDQGKKSLAFDVTLTPSDVTLTEHDIEKISCDIIKAVEGETGGILRDGIKKAP